MNHLKYLTIPTDLAEKKTVKGLSENAKDVQLTYMDKALYCYMKVKYDYFQSKKQDFFESQDTFSEYFSISKRTVQRMLDKLVEAGLISVKYTDRNNVYVVYDYKTQSLNDLITTTYDVDDDQFPF